MKKLLILAMLAATPLQAGMAYDAALAALRSAQPPSDVVKRASVLANFDGSSTVAQDIRTVAQWVLDTAAVNEGDTK
jgi:predicted DNA-binding transcriptional regulator YafY